MDLTRTAFGTWSGGKYMHFGEELDDARYIGLIQRAYEKGIRTFVTADVYGNGAADSMIGMALAGKPRESYCLVGAIGHDFYTGKREGSKGYPRFTNPALRQPAQFTDYVVEAVEKSLKRCGTHYFDLLFLHNPDATGYTSPDVWHALSAAQQRGLTKMLGIAPGPANGFTLDLIYTFERFGHMIDWAMIILNPLEPWPGHLVFQAATAHNVRLITRVVDYGGLFHDDVLPGHNFRKEDHRVFRPMGWVEAGREKIEAIRDIARSRDITLLQLACLWNLSQPPVLSVVPTLIQEAGLGAKPIEAKLDELADLGSSPRLNTMVLPEDQVEAIRQIGNNTGCMALKGGAANHTGDPEPDHWSLTPELLDVAKRWHINPEEDLAYTHRKS